MSTPKVVTPGVCRVCGCTELTPCRGEDNLPCTWVDEDRTLCDNLECIAQVSLGELEAMKFREDPLEIDWRDLPHG